MIRKLHKDDIDSVANIWLNTNLQAHWFIDEQYWKKNYELVKGMLLDAEVYVYVENNEVYGFIGINEEHIEGIFINSEAQSRGLGKSLLDFVKEKKERLHLNVYQKNTRAISFYKKEGFKIESTSIDEITKEKEYFMVWKRIEDKENIKNIINNF